MRIKSCYAQLATDPAKDSRLARHLALRAGIEQKAGGVGGVGCDKDLSWKRTLAKSFASCPVLLMAAGYNGSQEVCLAVSCADAAPLPQRSA